jgi:Spy/CpxP family protein refolding chaperone
MGRGGVGRQGLGAGGRGVGGFAALDLTEDQRAKVEDLHRAGRDQAGPIQDELDLAHKTLHRELFADNRDAAKVSTLTAKIASLQRQLADLHVRTASSVADVLTAEQRETMRLRDGRGGGMGRGPGRHRPAAR